MILSTDLLKFIRDKYGSLDNPNFSFVEKVAVSGIYDNVVEKLKQRFSVNEITDLNEDVCFRYIIKKDEQDWVIELSMLGLFATILRPLANNLSELVLGPDQNENEAEIFEILIENSFSLLSKGDLEKKVSLKYQ